jgi:hypothetical protein
MIMTSSGVIVALLVEKVYKCDFLLPVLVMKITNVLLLMKSGRFEIVH